jgi:predicted nucleic acid-binding protein
VRLVLDADVVIGALDASDAHHADARGLFAQWREHNASTLVSVVTLSEVLVAPAADTQRLRRAREAIASLGIEVYRAGEAIGVDAARLRGSHPISLADAYCLATARHTGSSVASFDQKVLRAAETEAITSIRVL